MNSAYERKVAGSLFKQPIEQLAYGLEATAEAPAQFSLKLGAAEATMAFCDVSAIGLPKTCFSMCFQRDDIRKIQV